MQRRWLIAIVGLLASVLVVWRCRNQESAGSDHTGSAGSSFVARNARSQPRPDPKALIRSSLAGTVKDQRGAPIAGARVCARGTAAELADELLREPACAKADGTGAYVVTGLLPAIYTVGASARKYQPALFEQRDVRGIRIRAGEHRTGIDLVLLDGGVELAGVVHDLTGGPIERARVWGPAHELAETDAKGDFAMWVAPGTVAVIATADGYTDNHEEIDVPKQGLVSRVEIVLTPEATLAGIVVDGATNQPVAGARVVVGDSDWDWDSGTETFTDERGAFRVARLIPKRYVVVARTDSGYGRTDGSLLAGLAQNVDGVVVKLWPAHRIDGRVVVSGTKEDCPDAHVMLSDPAAKRNVDLRKANDGTHFAEGVLPGTYYVHVGCPNAVAHASYGTLTISNADMRGVIWEVDAGATLVGRITRDGEPVRAAVIAARREGGTSDKGSSSSTNSKPDGSYEIRGLSAGSFKLVVEAETDFVAKVELVIEIPANAKVTRDIVLTAEPVGEITGTVVDASGAPVPGIDVGTRTPKLGSGTSTKTNASGTFTFSRVRPGDYLVYAMRDYKVLRKPGTTDDANHNESATVKVGQTTTVRLVIESPTERITGTVVDAAGKPIADAFVAAARESDAAGALRGSAAGTRWNWDVRPVLTATDGAFEIGKLTPGTYTVRAYRRGGGEAIAENIAAGGSTKLTIRPTASIEGSVRRSGGTVVEDLAITIRDTTNGYRRREEFFRTAGRFVLRDIPQGSYVVVADAAGGTKQVDVELKEGETRTGLDIELIELVTLTGRIVQLGTATPVAGFHVIARPLRGGGMYMSDPRRDTSDAAGRFTVYNASQGQLAIMTWPDGDSDYTGVTTFRTVSRGGTVDIGDIEVIKRRIKQGETPGNLGIRFAQQPVDTPPDKRETKVSYIDPKGPAVKSGIEIDDVLVSVDGVDIRGDNVGRAKALIAAPAGTKLGLGLARGVTIYVVLAAP